MLCRNLNTCTRKTVLMLGQKVQCLKRLFASWRKWLQNVSFKIVFTLIIDKKCGKLVAKTKFFFSLIFLLFLVNNITARPPAVENQEADPTAQAVKRRLPREIKLKLAKVARLAVLANAAL